MSDTISQLMNRLAADGWAGIDGLRDSFDTQSRDAGRQLKTEQDRQAGIVARALETEDGRAFLDLLLRKTVLRPPEPEERAARTADEYAIAKARRDGQNSIVFMLLGMLQHHATGQTNNGEQL